MILKVFFYDFYQILSIFINWDKFITNYLTGVNYIVQ